MPPIFISGMKRNIAEARRLYATAWWLSKADKMNSGSCIDGGGETDGDRIYGILDAGGLVLATCRYEQDAVMIAAMLCGSRWTGGILAAPEDGGRPDGRQDDRRGTRSARHIRPGRPSGLR